MMSLPTCQTSLKSLNSTTSFFLLESPPVTTKLHSFYKNGETTDIPQNPKIEFLKVQATIGKSGLNYFDFDFNSFDLAKDWVQTTINPKFRFKFFR